MAGDTVIVDVAPDPAVSVTVVGFSSGVGPPAEIVAESETEPENPLTLVRVIVDVLLVPACNIRDDGLATIEKSPVEEKETVVCADGQPAQVAYIVAVPRLEDLIVTEQEPLLPVVQVEEERVPRVVENDI